MTKQQRDTADYLAQTCFELAKLAKHQRFETLAYLLDIAALEAGQVAQPKEQAKDAA